jgi:hypothetical protein
VISVGDFFLAIVNFQFSRLNNRHGLCVARTMLEWRSARRDRIALEIRRMVKPRMSEPVEILSRRMDRIEQILPTLATKDDLKTLATREELRLAISTAVAPLATKKELRLAVQEEGERSRRYMDVLTESLREDIHLIAGHVASARPKRTEP